MRDDPLATLAAAAFGLGVFALAGGFGLTLAVGMQVCRWWMRCGDRLDPRAAELVEADAPGATAEAIRDLLLAAGPAGVPVVSRSGERIGVLALVEAGAGHDVVMTWSCGCTGCAGHPTREGARFHRAMIEAGAAGGGG